MQFIKKILTGLLDLPSAAKPAERWNLDKRFTTCGDACVRTPTAPP